VVPFLGTAICEGLSAPVGSPTYRLDVNISVRKLALHVLLHLGLFVLPVAKMQIDGFYLRCVPGTLWYLLRVG
jgi:hypothetical protein